MLGFRMEEISELINDINLITGVNCVLYDKDFHVLHAYKNSMCSFCSLVRSDQGCHEKCLECDRHGLTAAMESGKTYRYKCHMGLTETVTPIVCEGMTVGFVMAGQKLLPEDLPAVRMQVDAFPIVSARDALHRELAKIRSTTKEELDAMSELVRMCADYLHMKKLIRFQDAPLEVQLRQYVDANLAEELDVETLCHNFGMSKSSLYLLSRKALGMGVTDYIRERRLKRACELLMDTALPVSAVAERVGYSDMGYFTKVFKKQMGCTPSAYRKNRF
jgi:AraC-like DNA-binding protein